MNRWSAIAMFAIAVLAFAGCLPRATEQECSDMCARLVILKAGKDAGPLDQRIAAIGESHLKRIAGANAQKDAALAELDKQMAEKLAAAKSDEDKKKVTDEFTPLKEKTAKDAELALADLEVRTAQEIATANEKAKALEADSAKILEDCIAQSKKERTLQKVAQCRMEAEDIDAYYNRCR
ncbi:MAG: hypothetical protein MUC50_20115 [Myxococcota bacterium]|nr:hypothetical protein [Myxococcota bacterium]